MIDKQKGVSIRSHRLLMLERKCVIKVNSWQRTIDISIGTVVYTVLVLMDAGPKPFVKPDHNFLQQPFFLKSWKWNIYLPKGFNPVPKPIINGQIWIFYPSNSRSHIPKEAHLAFAHLYGQEVSLHAKHENKSDLMILTWTLFFLFLLIQTRNLKLKTANYFSQWYEANDC